MSQSFTLDLRLTTLEFDGLLYALDYYTGRIGTCSDWELTDDELILDRFNKAMTDSRIEAWEKRRRREGKRRGSLLQPSRYTYKAERLLVNVLYRLLANEAELPTSCRRLLDQLHQVRLNDLGRRRTRARYYTATDPIAGIVDTTHSIV